MCCVHESGRPRSRCRPGRTHLLRLRRKVPEMGRTSPIAWKSAHASWLLLRPGHAALCGMLPIARGLWPIANRTWPLRPSHAARCRLRPIARGLWPITNRTWPNSDQALPVACAIHPLGIARCCVQLVHIQAARGGGCVAYLL